MLLTILSPPRPVALSGIVPLVFVGWVTAPYVLFVHVRVPPHARVTREALSRHLARLRPDERLAVTTMSAIAKPRVSAVRVAELRRADPALGLYNLVRADADVAAENARRRWYHFGAVSRFNVQDGRSELWDAVAARIPRA